MSVKRANITPLLSAVAMLLMLGVSGCVPQVGLVSSSPVTSHESIETQRAWLEESADDAIAVMGVPSGWYSPGYLPEDSIDWDDLENRDRILRGLLSRECAGSYSGQLHLGLINDVVPDNIDEIMERLRVAWEAEGAEVSGFMVFEEPVIQARDGITVRGLHVMKHRIVFEATSSCSSQMGRPDADLLEEEWPDSEWPDYQETNPEWPDDEY